MADFKNKTKEELKKILAEKRKALQTFRFSTAGSKVRNIKEGMAVRKDIARILTELNTVKA